MDQIYREVITPNAACMLFGKSGEAVRRAVAQDIVPAPCELRFAPRPIRLLDFEAATAYWFRNPWPAYQEPFKEQVARMRSNSILISACGPDGTPRDNSFSHYRILHYEPILYTPLLVTNRLKDIDFDD